MAIESELERAFGLRNVECAQLEVPTNDVFQVDCDQGRFAFKIYNVQSRSESDVRWEVDLVDHLLDRSAPIPAIVKVGDQAIQHVLINGTDRIGVLFEWAQGEKPNASHETYALLGSVAARVHRATDDFELTENREVYDRRELIDNQLLLIEPLLKAAGQWETMFKLGERLSKFLDTSELDWGLCHMDLTLDNVYRDEDKLTVFDFDSAGACWRAIEPHGVLLNRAEYFDTWIANYREVRPFSDADEKAVHVFCVVGEIRNVAWKLGVAKSSRGIPLLEVSDIPDIVEGWLELEESWA